MLNVFLLKRSVISDVPPETFALMNVSMMLGQRKTVWKKNWKEDSTEDSMIRERLTTCSWEDILSRILFFSLSNLAPDSLSLFLSFQARISTSFFSQMKLYTFVRNGIGNMKIETSAHPACLIKIVPITNENTKGRTQWRELTSKMGVFLSFYKWRQTSSSEVEEDLNFEDKDFRPVRTTINKLISPWFQKYFYRYAQQNLFPWNPM